MSRMPGALFPQRFEPFGVLARKHAQVEEMGFGEEQQ